MAESYARLLDGTVVEIITLADGAPPLQRTYHPSLIAQMQRLTAEQTGVVEVGWRLVDGALVAPPAPPDPEPVVSYVPASLARERLEADGFWDEFSEILASNPAAMLKVLTLREGIDPTDPQAVMLIGACGADPARILAPPGTDLPPLTAE